MAGDETEHLTTLVLFFLLIWFACKSLVVIVKDLPNREECERIFALFCLKLQSLDSFEWEEMGVEDEGAVDGEYMTEEDIREE